MSQLAQLGLHAIVGLSAPSLLDEEKALLKSLRPLGVILFRKNLAQHSHWKDSLRDLIDEVKQLISRDEVIISIDHEGGLVHRFGEDVTRFPPALNWQDRAAEVGKAMGIELSSLGISLNFAPVLDCWSEPKNTVIGDRAFSKSPKCCAAPAIEFALAMQSAGVMACGKHFPGHGATLMDSHFDLPVLDSTLEELEECELIPFREYISQDFNLIMNSHVLYKSIDSEFPASLSKKVNQNLLREYLGYQGCIITDDLEMKALAIHSLDEISTKTIAAGVDILLEGNPSNELALMRLKSMLEAVAKAIDSGEISSELLLESKSRIEKLLIEHGRIRKLATSKSSEILACSQHLQLAKKLSA